jgi:hypothetical protein
MHDALVSQSVPVTLTYFISAVHDDGVFWTEANLQDIRSFFDSNLMPHEPPPPPTPTETVTPVPTATLTWPPDLNNHLLVPVLLR